MKKRLITILTICLIVITNSSVSFAISEVNPNPILNKYINSLETIDGHMNVLMKSIATPNANTAEINKDIKFIETLINDLTLETSKLAEKDNDVILAMQVILNYYKIAIINAKKFIATEDVSMLINAIMPFTLGYDSASSLRTIIGRVR
jgi:hypothetical protein